MGGQCCNTQQIHEYGLDEKIVLSEPVRLKEEQFVAFVFTQKQAPQYRKLKFKALPPRDVRINVLFCGLTYDDFALAEGHLFAGHYPIVPGCEIVARVAMVGSMVANLEKGDLVGIGFQRTFCKECEQCLQKREQYCKTHKITGLDYKTFYPKFGGLSTKLQVPIEACTKLPQDCDPLQTVPLLYGGLSVYAAIGKCARPSSTLAVIGYGPLAQVAVKIAVACRLNVTVFIAQPIASEHLNLKFLPYQEMSKNQHRFEVVFACKRDATSQDVVQWSELLDSDGALVLFNHDSSSRIKLPFKLLIDRRFRLMTAPLGSKSQLQDLLALVRTKQVKFQLEVVPFKEAGLAFKAYEKRSLVKQIIQVQTQAQELEKEEQPELKDEEGKVQRVSFVNGSQLSIKQNQQRGQQFQDINSSIDQELSSKSRNEVELELLGHIESARKKI